MVLNGSVFFSETQTHNMYFKDRRREAEDRVSMLMRNSYLRVAQGRSGNA